MSNRILQNIADDKFLEEEGYIVLPFLNEEEVKTLRNFYFESHPDNKEGLYATAHSSSYEFKKKMSDEILSRFGRALNEVFFESRPLGGSYIVKYKGERGVLFPHQDWNIVDEDFFRSFNIWVPLVDTNNLNGAIAVLPRSHKLIKSFRGVNIADPFTNINAHTWKFHKTLSLKAGEALVYDHRLLHASAINETDEPRVAVVFGIIPQKAEMRLYYMNGEVVSEYENSVDFFFRNNILQGPQGLKKLRDLDYKVDYITEEEFEGMMNGKVIQQEVEQSIGKDKTYFQRIKKAFGL